MAADRNARIEERAYHLWLAEGRPDGRHDEHWRRAERELIEEERGLREAPSATIRHEGAGAVGAASRQGPATAEPVAAGRPASGSRVPDQSKADPPTARSRARSSRPAAAGSGSRGSRRSATAKPAS